MLLLLIYLLLRSFAHCPRRHTHAHSRHVAPSTVLFFFFIRLKEHFFSFFSSFFASPSYAASLLRLWLLPSTAAAASSSFASPFLLSHTLTGVALARARSRRRRKTCVLVTPISSSSSSASCSFHRANFRIASILNRPTLLLLLLLLLLPLLAEYISLLSLELGDRVTEQVPRGPVARTTPCHRAHTRTNLHKHQLLFSSETVRGPTPEVGSQAA